MPIILQAGPAMKSAMESEEGVKVLEDTGAIMVGAGRQGNADNADDRFRVHLNDRNITTVHNTGSDQTKQGAHLLRVGATCRYHCCLHLGPGLRCSGRCSSITHLHQMPL